MNLYLLDLDNLPGDFFDDIRKMAPPDVRWFDERKVYFECILLKYNVSKLDKIPTKTQKCLYCGNENESTSKQCVCCGAPNK
jgi:hypothetical protein